MTRFEGIKTVPVVFVCFLCQISDCMTRFEGIKTFAKYPNTDLV